MPARADPCQTCRAQEPVTHREPCWPSVVCPKESPSAELQPMLARGSRARAAPKCLEKRNEKCLDRVKNSLIEFKRLAYNFRAEHQAWPKMASQRGGPRDASPEARPACSEAGFISFFRVLARSSVGFWRSRAPIWFIFDSVHFFEIDQ
jgi:hypothetical protein